MGTRKLLKLTNKKKEGARGKGGGGGEEGKAGEGLVSRDIRIK